MLGVHTHPDGTTLLDWWTELRGRVDKVYQRGFDSLALLICWKIWLFYNDEVFNNHHISSDTMVVLIWDEVELWCGAGAN